MSTRLPCTVTNQSKMLEGLFGEAVSACLLIFDKLIKVLLRMGAGLSTRSCSDTCMNFVPILAIQMKSLDKSLVLLVSPSSILGRLVC